MKAEIKELWDSGREFIGYEGTHTERPQTIADLKKCENVLIDNREPGGYYTCMVDNSLYTIKLMKAQHPYGGTIYFYEIF